MTCFVAVGCYYLASWDSSILSDLYKLRRLEPGAWADNAFLRKWLFMEFQMSTQKADIGRILINSTWDANLADAKELLVWLAKTSSKKHSLLVVSSNFFDFSYCISGSKNEPDADSAGIDVKKTREIS